MIMKRLKSDVAAGRCRYVAEQTVLAVALLIGFAGHAAEPITLRPGPPEPLSRKLQAFNSNLLMATAFHGITYGGPEFRQGLRDLRPGGLRFPGGTTANNYRWREDSFSPQANDRTQWAGQQLELFRKIGRKYDLPGYAKICHEFGMEPIWVLNVYEETPASVVELFERLDELGLAVKAVEMGNEPYWDPRSLMNVWKYSEYCRPLAAALRKHRPEVKIGACFGPLRKDQTYREKWNAALAKQDWYDAIVYHEYFGGQGFALEEGVEIPLNAMLHPEALFDEPVEYFAQLLPGKPIWFTEWNIGQKALGQWKNTGAELLFLGASLTRLMRHREHIEWSCFHQIYEAKFGTFFYDKNGRRIETLPSYEFFRLIGAAWSDADKFLPLNTVASDALLGFATQGADGVRWLLINRGSDPVEARLSAGAEGELAGLVIAVEPTASLPQSRNIARGLRVVDRVVTLPGYSISLIGSPELIGQATRVDLVESGNLFPVRPHLTLWYAPFARRQPRVGPDGSYTLKLAELAGKKSAVVKMNCADLGLRPGRRYTVRFNARSTEGAGVVVKLPDAGNADGEWLQLSPRSESFRVSFDYSLATNEGNVSFFLTESALAKGGELVLSDFNLVSVTTRGNAR